MNAYRGSSMGLPNHQTEDCFMNSRHRTSMGLSNNQTGGVSWIRVIGIKWVYPTIIKRRRFIDHRDRAPIGLPKYQTRDHFMDPFRAPNRCFNLQKI